MFTKHTITFAFLVCLSFSVFSQMSKADKYFDNGEYFKAIPIYKKESRSKNTVKQQEALLKLGNSYKLISKSAEAEDAYKRLLDINPESPKEVFLNYAQTLKQNAKYDEAVEQYNNYLKLNPNDQAAKNAMKFCIDIKRYLSRPVEYYIKNMDAVNTEKAEFCPFVVDKKLMFVAERQSFDFINYAVNDYNGQPFLNMYISEIEGSGSDLQKSKTFSKKVNTDYHDGPACLTSDGKTLYFTRVNYIDKKGFVNRSQIYTAEGSNKSWKNIQAITLNNPDYSIAHPSISADNNTLYFTSDMPGGYGGKDIYLSIRSGDTWGTPVNLGPDINTSGDEMFPTIRKDGMLFFASSGLPGFGGLDIYSAKQMSGKWILNRNEGLNLNSSADDFGITFLNDTMGYFSTNRTGGKGSDDIYFYEFKNKAMVVSGNVLLTENVRDYAKNKKVYLLDEEGNVLDSTYTDAKGFFAFKNLDGDKRYMAVIDEEDPELVGKARFYLSESDSVIHRVTSKYKDNKFVFRNLPIDPNALPDLYTEDDLVFAGTLKVGDKGDPLVNTKLKLINDFGDVVEESTTNEYGAFAFRNIPSDQNYMVDIEEGDVQLAEGTKIILTNKLGKDVRTFYKGKGRFYFKILTADKNLLDEMDAEDVNLVMGIYGYMYDQNKRPISNAKLRIKDENGSNEQIWNTANNGKFNFKNLDAEKNYIFETDENDPSLSGVKRIFIADSRGRIYKVVEMVGGKFSFKVLEVDKFYLGEFVVEDPSLKQEELKKELALQKENSDKKLKEPKEPKLVVKEEPEEESELSITIVENIYYAYGDYKISPEAEVILLKAAEAMTEYPKLTMEISSHTDAQSSSEFNMGLSRRRAQTAVDYLVNKGVSRTRLKAKGYGEMKLLNKCEDNVQCTEEEHKVNRRTEFRITKPTKK